MAEVIEWNTNPSYDISVEAIRDPRTRIVHDDVVNLCSKFTPYPS